MADPTQHTRELLLAHSKKYPQAELQDYMKFLYQSAFGCEHLLTDREAAMSYLHKEAAAVADTTSAEIEMLDGPYVRAHLGLLKNGLAVDTLGTLFVLSAEHHEGGTAQLEEKLQVLLKMLHDRELPFDTEAAESAIQHWREMGFPAVHHSETFRACYAPAYRLIKAEYVRLLPLLGEIDRRSAGNERVILAIDGNCASGKSTLADLLHAIYGCTVFHMDDFFLRPEQRTPERYAEPGGNVDRERFAEEVLVPLTQGKPVHYQRFDCHSMSLQPAQLISPTPVTVIEGSYSLHPALRDQYDLSVVLQINPEKQMARIRARNNEASARMFAEKWIPLEQRYFDTFHPADIADFVIPS